jgi:hypothetical protein
VNKFRAFCSTTGLITVFRTTRHCYIPNSHSSRPHSHHNQTLSKPYTKTDIRFAFLRNGQVNLPFWTFILRATKLSIYHPLSLMLSRYSDQATSWTSRVRFPAWPRISLFRKRHILQGSTSLLSNGHSGVFLWR